MKRIVLAFDESPEARRALDTAALLAKAFDARVLVTSIAPALMPAGHGIGPYDPSDPPERHLSLARDGVATLTERAIEAEPVTGVGDPGHAIVEIADRHDADLIVIGMSHHPHLSRIFGGVSEGVAHHANCDVLLVR
jgi:nucleotide-binding universal stress UspA family protein